MAEKNDIFNRLNNIDVSEKVKEKNKLTYLPWAWAWAEVKKECPEVEFRIVPQIIDEYGNTRFWHDDGKSGWVEVEVTIGGLTHSEVLAIMDFRNQAIPAEKITSTEANKTFKRCLTKALALHGLGLYIYSGEDLPEELGKITELQEAIIELATKKTKLSENAKAAVIEKCKAAEKQANPNKNETLITGKEITSIENIDILEQLKDELLMIRK